MTGYDFMYQLISAVSQSISVIVMNISLDFILTGRGERASKGKRITLWSLFTIVFVVFKCFCPAGKTYYIFVNPAVLTLFYIFMVTYFYCDKLWVRITHVSMIVIQNTMADVILFAILGDIPKLDFAARPFANPVLAERCVMVGALSVLFNIIYVTLVQRMKKAGNAGANPVWIAAILPAFLVSYGFWSKSRPQYVSGENNLYVVVMTVWMCLQFVFAMVYLSYLQKREMQEEADKLSHAMTLEQIRYEQMEARREELSKLRHDYNNILASVLFLLKNKRTKEAQRVIADLLNRVDDAQKPCYKEEKDA